MVGSAQVQAVTKVSALVKITQLTHHDLDGYGASTVAAAYADIAPITHIARYSDVGPVVATELHRLTRASAPEMVLMTDLGLEAVAVTFIRDFEAMNARRGGERQHRLIVLDHHASSVDQLAAQGLLPSPSASEAWPSLKEFLPDDPAISILIDETRCATRLTSDHRSLFASKLPESEAANALPVLVEAIDAVDLWQKNRSIFRQALVLDEVFWDNVTGCIPVGHPWHDGFVGRLLLGLAARLGGGATPAAIEREAGVLRAQVVDDMLRGEPGDDPEQTTRMRIAPVLARSPDLFLRLPGGAKLSFGLDSGTFQRVSDAVMASGDATLVINVQRSGSMSFRSNDETALEAARKFRGGGHKDAAGGRLVSGGAVSLADAAAQVVPVLDPPKPDLSKSPFAALQGFKA